MAQFRHTKETNSRHLIKAFYHALWGLRVVFRDDMAFRQEVFLSIIIIPLGLYLGITSIEKAILVGAWFLVLLMEIVNSSIESLVDRISFEIHPLSKKIKDMGAAAVLLSIINGVVVWGIIISTHGAIFH